MPLGLEVGLDPDHIVLDGVPAPPKGAQPQFLNYVCCGQTAEYINMPLGTEVGLGPGDIVLDRNPALPPRKGAQQSPKFSPHLYCGQTVAHLSNCRALVSNAAAI